jgi:hypothetical protein
VLTRSERCSQASETRDEPMAGTASTVRSWLLLEDPGPWGRDALQDARLPEFVGLELQRRCRAAGVRPLLIRRASTNASSPASSPGLACFAIRSGPEPPWIERTRLARVADILDLDLPALGRGVRPGFEPVDGPLFLVCTHGRRDVCCAERGRPLAGSLAGALPDATWESSHVGGDRFAGNLVAFPHGLYLGRVRPDEAAEVARAYADGRVSLPHLRGRSCYPMPVQAAEHALRTREGFDRVDDLGLERTERRRGVSTSTFRTPMGRFSVSIAIEESAPSFLTCHSLAAERAPTYRTIAIVRRPDLDGDAS